MFAGMKKTFSDFIYIIIAISLALNFLVLDYVIFTQSTTFIIFFSQNAPLYIWLSISLSIMIAILFGIAMSMLIFVLKQKMHGAGSAAGGGFFGAGFGAIASGCPVCGAWLLPLFGIAGSLAAFPFQGLEIKALAILLLLYSIHSSAKSVLGLCSTKRWRSLLIAVVIVALFIAIIFALPKLPSQYKFSISQISNSASAASPVGVSNNQLSSALDDDLSLSVLLEQINPEKGFSINAKFGQIGKRLINDGVIDFELFKAIYDRAGAPLTPDQLKIFDEGLNEKITINRENSYFLLNFFWAFGLVNKNPILDEGEITKYGKDEIGSFASTGGWTIATKPVMEIFSNSEIIVLTSEQQARVLEVASNAYRPCCGNSTAFPDCNHGMALLGMLQLLAASDASVDEMFEAAKYFNAFWFPREYVDLATYFKVVEGQDFNAIDARTIVSDQYSSGFGWGRIKKWLGENNLVEKAPQGGGGCGV
ncbi:MAG: hypothetical protein L3J15_05155 [Devosiaceae bacterium]|nr:hypothetical protein [Devosiaceae bacterium]